MRAYLIAGMMLVTLLVGTPAQAYDVKNITATEFTEIATTGNDVKFIFLFTSWCSVCKSNFPQILEYYKRFHGKPVKIIALSLDNDERKLTSFLRKLPNNDLAIYRLNNQHPKDTMQAFSQVGIKYQGRIPHVTLIDRDGNVAADGGYQISSLGDGIEYLLK